MHFVSMQAVSFVICILCNAVSFVFLRLRRFAISLLFSALSLRRTRPHTASLFLVGAPSLGGWVQTCIVCIGTPMTRRGLISSIQKIVMRHIRRSHTYRGGVPAIHCNVFDMSACHVLHHGLQHDHEGVADHSVLRTALSPFHPVAPND